MYSWVTVYTAPRLLDSQSLLHIDVQLDWDGDLTLEYMIHIIFIITEPFSEPVRSLDRAFIISLTVKTNLIIWNPPLPNNISATPRGVSHGLYTAPVPWKIKPIHSIIHLYVVGTSQTLIGSVSEDTEVEKNPSGPINEFLTSPKVAAHFNTPFLPCTRTESLLVYIQ